MGYSVFLILGFIAEALSALALMGSSERSADMKTSPAIVFTTAALMFGAILSLTSGVAAHDYGSLSGKTPGRCGVVACPSQQQATTSSSQYGSR